MLPLLSAQARTRRTQATTQEREEPDFFGLLGGRESEPRRTGVPGAFRCAGVARGSGFPRRPVILWQSDTLTQVLQSVLVIPLTTNRQRANLAGTALVASTPDGLPEDSVALAFQLRAIPKAALQTKIRSLTEDEVAELELATEEVRSGKSPRHRADPSLR